MIKEEIVDYFKSNCDSRGIPNIPNAEWKNFISLHDKDDIRDSLAEYIHRYSIPFPFKMVDKDYFEELFRRFCNTSALQQIRSFDVVEERYDYKNKYSDKPLGVIDKSHIYNDVSDYFQQKNRLNCGSNTVSSPIQIWKDKDKLSKMNWTFWREAVMEKSDMCEKTFRTSFRLGTYTATQFRPTVAKAVYEKYSAVNILDTSCGWGDRLAGFYATPSTQLYVGCDPNSDVFETYKEQCLYYEKLLGNDPLLTESENYFECVGKKTVKIWRKPAEEVEWEKYKDTFDLYFTSPPYFNTEKYAEGTNNEKDQSWSRYDNFQKWRDEFFFKINRQVWQTIKQDGYMMINIIEPRTSASKRLNLCDDMVEHFTSFENCKYVGKIGMRMMARPNAKELKSVFIEPIWVFKKFLEE